MSPDQATTPTTPEAAPAPSAQVNLRDALAARMIGGTHHTPEPGPKDAPDASAVVADPPTTDAPEEPAEESAPDSDGETPEAPADDPFAGLSRKQRGEALKAAKAELEQERTAREQAEQRAQQLEALNSEADNLLVTLEGTDTQLADLKRRARAGDANAREQADIYEANREMLGPVRLAMRKKETARAWGAIGDDFRAIARHLPEGDRQAFLDAANVKEGGDLFVAKLKHAAEKPLKDEIKALKAEIAGLKADIGSRGASPVHGGRSANGSSPLRPDASGSERIRAGIAARLGQSS